VPSTQLPANELEANELPADASLEHTLAAHAERRHPPAGKSSGDAIRRLAGEQAFALVEDIRSATKTLREQPSPELARGLRDRLAQLDLPALKTLIRAFSIYFDLINLAEQRVRLRVLRWQAQESSHPASDGFEAALLQLRGKRRACAAGRRSVGPRTDRSGLLRRTPAARRRTILEKLDSITRLMDKIESEQLFPREREAPLPRSAEEIETFWLSSLVRDERPTVLDEVRQSAGMVHSLLDVVPRLYRELEAALQRVYPELVRNAREFPALRLMDRGRSRRASAGDPHRHERGRAGPA